jgi:hypothetical protein
MRALVSATERQQPSSVDGEVNASDVDVEGMKQREEVISLIIQGKILEVCASEHWVHTEGMSAPFHLRPGPCVGDGTEHMSARKSSSLQALPSQCQARW